MPRSMPDALDTYAAIHPGEAGVARMVSDLYQDIGADMFLVSRAEHITTSCLVVCPGPSPSTHISEAHVALIAHRIYGRPLPPGGHVEPGESAAMASVREASEELGLGRTLLMQGLESEIFDIDVHEAIHGRDAGVQQHIDLRYLTFVATRYPLVAESAEVEAAFWEPVASMVCSAALGKRCYGKLLKRLEVGSGHFERWQM